MKKHYFLSLLCSFALFGCGNDDSGDVSNEPAEKPECTDNSECDSGKCLGSGKCAQMASEGEQCGEETVCTKGLECIKGICKTPVECTQDKDCKSGKCLSSGDCAPIVGKGEQCGDNAVCSTELECVHGICKDLTEGCSTDDDCADEADGHTTCLPSRSCGTLHAKGSTCDDILEVCETGLECTNDVCIQRVGRGERCSDEDWSFCALDLVCVNETCFTKEETTDPGPNPESEPVTDDSDILTGITLPGKNPINNACMACQIDEHCVNNACVKGWKIYTFVGTPITSENGGKVSVGIALDPYPEKDVRFKCWIESDSPYPEANVDCSNVVIPAGDVTPSPLKNITNTYYFDVTGIPDQIDDGTKMYYLMVQGVSESSKYNDVIRAPLAMMNLNVDRAGVAIKADKNLQTDENGAKTSYTVALQSKPVAPVRLKLHSSDLSEGTVEPHVIDFTPENWNTPQTVTVTGVDDKYLDGTQYYWISTKTVSFDPKYNDIKVRDVIIPNVDNDKVAVSLACNDYKLTQSASSSDISVVLNIKPKNNIKVRLYSLDSNLIEIPKEAIEFTPDNWNVPQNVRVSVSKFDETTQAVTNVCVYALMELEDGIDDETMSNTWCFDIYRHGPLDFPYTGNEQTVTLLPGEYEVEVWGAQGQGSQNGVGGYGGYAHGKYILKEKKELYISAGGNTLKPASVAGDLFVEQWGIDMKKLTTFNGGGSGNGCGGDATHIATVSGELFTLSEQRDKVLIVAGGGGGGRFAYGGFGGGLMGGAGTLSYNRSDKVATGGTQDNGGDFGHSVFSGNGNPGSFGLGGSGIGEYSFKDSPNPHYDGAGAGGSGWYGGGGVPYGGGGGGGSGHIGSDIVDGETLDGSGQYDFSSPLEGTELGHAGTGHARITIIEKEPIIVN